LRSRRSVKALSRVTLAARPCVGRAASGGVCALGIPRSHCDEFLTLTGGHVIIRTVAGGQADSRHLRRVWGAARSYNTGSVNWPPGGSGVRR
jgi:hypothetical protein